MTLAQDTGRLRWGLNCRRRWAFRHLMSYMHALWSVQYHTTFSSAPPDYSRLGLFDSCTTLVLRMLSTSPYFNCWPEGEWNSAGWLAYTGGRSLVSIFVPNSFHLTSFQFRECKHIMSFQNKVMHPRLLSISPCTKQTVGFQSPLRPWFHSMTRHQSQ